MQTASLEYKKTIRQLPRNRGYIRATIGIINQEAQNSASAKESKLAYFSNDTKPFEGNSVSRIYATAEKNFSKITGFGGFCRIISQYSPEKPKTYGFTFWQIFAII